MSASATCETETISAYYRRTYIHTCGKDSVAPPSLLNQGDRRRSRLLANHNQGGGDLNQGGGDLNPGHSLPQLGISYNGEQARVYPGKISGHLGLKKIDN